LTFWKEERKKKLSQFFFCCVFIHSFVAAAAADRLMDEAIARLPDGILLNVLMT